MPHYPSMVARRADLTVHVVGLALAGVGGCVLLEVSLSAHPGHIVAIGVYVACLIAMLSFSLVYNLDPRSSKPGLRRLDHAGIFLMIAGTYTPFTTGVLQDSWAWAMTLAVWTVASLGILGNAISFCMPNKIRTAIYVSLGWLVIVAVAPLARKMTPIAFILLIVGGVIYMLGALFYISRKPTLWRSIWHGHVVLAATCHWVAIFLTKFS